MIRRLECADIDYIISLEKRLLNTTLGSNYFNESFNNPLSYIYVIENNGIVGYVSTIFDGEILEILNICVDTLFQGMGYGRELFNYLIANLNPKSVILEVRCDNYQAINFYKALGLSEISKRKNYYDGYVDALVYNKCF